jgi:hypothetical protein
MGDRLFVFVSSTSDLAAEREALAAGLEPPFSPYLFERDRASSKTPKDRCQEMIDRSDVFVCLLGERQGTLYSFDVGARSIVEWEFETARARRHIELMTFQKEPLVNVDPGQQAFLVRIADFGKGPWIKRFKSSDQLVRDVSRSLLEWLVEFHARVQALRKRKRSRVQLLLLGLAGLGVGVLLAASVGFLTAPGSSWDMFTRTSLLATAGAVACLILLGVAFHVGGRRDN